MNIQKKVLILLLISAAWMQAMDQDKNKAGVQRPALGWIDKTLIDACTHGNQLTATRALEWGARINAQDNDGQTALHKAVIKSYQANAKYVQEFHERPELVQLLMHAGADCTIKDSDGISPLSALAEQEDSVSFRIALCIVRSMHHCKKHAQDPQDSLGKIAINALHKVNANNQEYLEQVYPLFNSLLRAGLDIVCVIPYYEKTLYRYAHDTKNERIKSMILGFQKEYCEQIHQAFSPKDFADQPLLHASLYPLIVECLYPQPEEGVMTRYCKELLTMPIQTKAEAQSICEKLQHFRSVDGDIWNARDSQGNTALQLATKQGNKPVVQWMYGLLAKDLSNAIEYADDGKVLRVVTSNPPCIYKDGMFIKRAIQAFAHLEEGKYSEYPDENACNRALEVLKILCAAGADLGDRYVHDPELVVDCDEETGLEFAITGYGCGDVVKLLLYLGVDHTRPNSETKKTPLEQARNSKIKALLKNPKETLENLTDAEKKEFADIKAEREKRLAAYKAAHSNSPAPAAGAGAGKD